jgi:hypothetical protein
VYIILVLVLRCQISSIMSSSNGFAICLVASCFVLSYFRMIRHFLSMIILVFMCRKVLSEEFR